MTNIAIVVAVSEYTGAPANLPACRHDGDAILHLLRSSNRFSDILHISSDTTASNVKRKIAEFAKSYGGKDIGEVFFYFTGHGEFVGNEFYYILSDYNERRRNQTSLDNSELDGIVRGLSPKLYVKIVDACQSGVAYIKSPDDLNVYLKSANKHFNDLYFMFSSDVAQSSYQDENISDFTGSILRSVCSHAADAIRYKDVISFVSDEFEGSSHQTPLFVTQANFTEVFCEISPAVKGEVKKFLHDSEEGEGGEPLDEQKAFSLFSILKADAEKYCTKYDAIAALENMLQFVKKTALSGDLAEIYDANVSDQQGKPPSPSAIGRWLDQDKGDEKYFAKSEKERERYMKRVLKDSAVSSLVSMATRLHKFDDDQIKEVEAWRVITSGFSFTTEMPYSYILIRYEPKLPNVSPEECFIVPLISRTRLRLFWAFSHFEYVDWERSVRIGSIEWSTNEVPLKNAALVEELIKKIEALFANFVSEPLKAKWTTSALGGATVNV